MGSDFYGKRKGKLISATEYHRQKMKNPKYREAQKLSHRKSAEKQRRLAGIKTREQWLWENQKKRAKKLGMC